MALTHTHNQAIASDVWTVNHGLGFKPAVTVAVHEQGVLQVILPKSVEYPSDSQVIVRFTSPRTGQARLV